MNRVALPRHRRPDPGDGVGPVQVRGGAYGLAVRYDALADLAGALLRCAEEIAEVAAAGHAALASPDPARAALDPAGAVRSAAALAAALDGPAGLVAAGVRVGGRGAEVTAAVARYRAAETLARAVPVERVHLGVVGIVGVDGVPLPGALAAGAVTVGAPAFPPRSVTVRAEGASAGPAAPRGIGDLIAGLQGQDERARGERQGEIAVTRLPRAGGGAAYVVDLPGTRDWQPDPRRPRPYLNDLQTNVELLAGRPTARLDGLARALAAAGVTPADPVLLVGHSQGGLLALRAAAQFRRSGRFQVTHVLTAGAPIGRIAVPPGVDLLALENRYDTVPALDGAPDPDERHRTTVRVALQTGTVGGNHSLRSVYLPAARWADGPAADGTSAQAWRRGASAFLTGPDGPSRTSRYDLRAAPVSG